MRGVERETERSMHGKLEGALCVRERQGRYRGDGERRIPNCRRKPLKKSGRKDLKHKSGACRDNNEIGMRMSTRIA